MFWSGHMPCDTCGQAVDRAENDDHLCDPQRREEFQMAALRHSVKSFEQDLADFLGRPQGLFETWLAARQVRRTA